MRQGPVWPSGSSGSMGDLFTPSDSTLDWQEDAACRGRDPDDFFAQGRGNLGAIQQAKKVCNTLCEVRDPCREYALAENIVHGVWGGLSSHQRAQARSQRRKSEKSEKWVPGPSE